MDVLGAGTLTFAHAKYIVTLISDDISEVADPVAPPQSRGIEPAGGIMLVIGTTNPSILAQAQADLFLDAFDAVL